MTSVSGIIGDVAGEYPDHLRDESRRTGQADSISFPKDEAAIRDVLREMGAAGLPVTVQGARTGITGGAVPDGGHILSLSRMNRILDLQEDAGSARLRVQPGVLLSEIHAYLAKTAWTFAPDPTERSASIGGMVSCNASGARSFRYGATRKHIEALRIVLIDGSVLALRRGESKAQGRAFSLATETGRVITGTLPEITMPDVKHAAGYCVCENMDLLDLFIGAEGTLGVISEIELRLLEPPAARWGLLAFLPDVEASVRFVSAIRDSSPRLAAIEFFDPAALVLLQAQKEQNPAFRDLPAMPEGDPAAIYVEIDGNSEEAVEAAVMGLSEALQACGGDPDRTWLAAGPREMARLKDLRHALPEAVNLLIDERRKVEPGLTKLGTDLAVPDQHLERVLAMYREGLDQLNLEAVMFGHIGDNHVHVNILPRSLEAYGQGKALYRDWARAVVDMGGTVSAEHGIGKLKREMLQIMYGKAGIAALRELKRLFDPDERLGRGTLF